MIHQSKIAGVQFLGLLATGCTPGAPQQTAAPPSAEASALAVATARFAADALSERLRAELTAAMQSGGAVAAASVRKVRASDCRRYGGRNGANIERKGLKVRNPGNAASDWQRDGLESFIQRHPTGEAWPTMSVAEIEGNTLNWMRPIALGKMCSRCHGGEAAVASETAAAIASAHPADQVRGFKPGDLRGALAARVRFTAKPSSDAETKRTVTQMRPCPGASNSAIARPSAAVAQW
jgi:hypothetical protein